MAYRIPTPPRPRGGGLIVQPPRRTPLTPPTPSAPFVAPSRPHPIALVVPASLPPPVAPVVPSSVPPPGMVRTVPTDRVRACDPLRFVLIGMALAAVLSTLISLLVLGIKRLDTPPSGNLIVTVAGPRGRAIPHPRVIADGTVVCEIAPCRVSKLAPGVHYVQVEAPGFGKSAMRAVRIERDADAVTHVELAPEPGLP